MKRVFVLLLAIAPGFVLAQHLGGSVSTALDCKTINSLPDCLPTSSLDCFKSAPTTKSSCDLGNLTSCRTTACETTPPTCYPSKPVSCPPKLDCPNPICNPKPNCNPTPAPEPASMMGLGFAVAGIFARRKKLAARA